MRVLPSRFCTAARLTTEAKATLKRIKEKFPDAFIVAYVGERSVSTAEALQMQR